MHPERWLKWELINPSWPSFPARSFPATVFGWSSGTAGVRLRFGCAIASSSKPPFLPYHLSGPEWENSSRASAILYASSPTRRRTKMLRALDTRLTARRCGPKLPTPVVRHRKIDGCSHVADPYVVYRVDEAMASVHPHRQIIVKSLVRAWFFRDRMNILTPSNFVAVIAAEVGFIPPPSIRPIGFQRTG